MHQLLQGTSRKLRNKARLIKKKVWKPKGEILQAKNGAEKTPRKSPKADKKTKANTNYYSMFQSTTSYVLDDINSIAYVNDRIYNLMKFKPRLLWGKALKCKCSKSKCQAKYCQCFSRNQVCSSQCSCEGCSNTDPSRYESVKLKQSIGLEGCRCSKSECLKNYCQCFQRGESCSDKCRCANCKNSL